MAPGGECDAYVLSPIAAWARAPIEARLAIVFAALAVRRWVEDQTGWPMEDHGQGRLRVYVHLVVLTVTSWVRSQTALRAILLGFNNDRAGEDGPVRARGGLRRPAGTASCLGPVPRRSSPCAAAVRRAADERCGGFPASASRPLSAVCVSSPAVPRARSRAVRRTARALETVEIVIAAPGRGHREGARHGPDLTAHRTVFAPVWLPKSDIGGARTGTAGHRMPCDLQFCGRGGRI